MIIDYFLIFDHLEGKKIFLFMDNLFKIFYIFTSFMTMISEKTELVKRTIYRQECINDLTYTRTQDFLFNIL